LESLGLWQKCRTPAKLPQIDQKTRGTTKKQEEKSLPPIDPPAFEEEGKKQERTI
jgi:hypothetical protein